MTKEEKRDRRTARHQVQADFKRHVTRRMGLFATGPQLQVATRTLTDRYYSEEIQSAVEKAQHVEQA